MPDIVSKNISEGNLIILGMWAFWHLFFSALLSFCLSHPIGTDLKFSVVTGK